MGSRPHALSGTAPTHDFEAWIEAKSPTDELLARRWDEIQGLMSRPTKPN